MYVVGMDTKQETGEWRLHKPEPMSSLENHLLPKYSCHSCGQSFPSEELLPWAHFFTGQISVTNLNQITREERESKKIAQIITGQVVNAMEKIEE